MQTSTLLERVACKNMCYMCKSPEHNVQASLPSKFPKYIHIYIHTSIALLPLTCHSSIWAQVALNYLSRLAKPDIEIQFNVAKVRQQA